MHKIKKRMERACAEHEKREGKLQEKYKKARPQSSSAMSEILYLPSEEQVYPRRDVEPWPQLFNEDVDDERPQFPRDFDGLTAAQKILYVSFMLAQITPSGETKRVRYRHGEDSTQRENSFRSSELNEQESAASTSDIPSTSAVPSSYDEISFSQEDDFLGEKNVIVLEGYEDEDEDEDVTQGTHGSFLIPGADASIARGLRGLARLLSRILGKSVNTVDDVAVATAAAANRAKVAKLVHAANTKSSLLSNAAKEANSGTASLLANTAKVAKKNQVPRAAAAPMFHATTTRETLTSFITRNADGFNRFKRMLENGGGATLSEVNGVVRITVTGHGYYFLTGKKNIVTVAEKLQNLVDAFTKSTSKTVSMIYLRNCHGANGGRLSPAQVIADYTQVKVSASRGVYTQRGGLDTVFSPRKITPLIQTQHAISSTLSFGSRGLINIRRIFNPVAIESSRLGRRAADFNFSLLGVSLSKLMADIVALSDGDDALLDEDSVLYRHKDYISDELRKILWPSGTDSRDPNSVDEENDMRQNIIDFIYNEVGSYFESNLDENGLLKRGAADEMSVGGILSTALIEALKKDGIDLFPRKVTLDTPLSTRFDYDRARMFVDLTINNGQEGSSRQSATGGHIEVHPVQGDTIGQSVYSAPVNVTGVDQKITIELDRMLDPGVLYQVRFYYMDGTSPETATSYFYIDGGLPRVSKASNEMVYFRCRVTHINKFQYLPTWYGMYEVQHDPKVDWPVETYYLAFALSIPHISASVIPKGDHVDIGKSVFGRDLKNKKNGLYKIIYFWSNSYSRPFLHIPEYFLLTD